MSTMQDALSKKDWSNLPKDRIAEIDQNDTQISGGRVIVLQKNNALFTGQFEKSDMDAFVYIWRQYLGNTQMIRGIKARLMQQANAMINNYRGEVCPIELMLYTSNVAASSFRNLRLISEVTEAVYLILQKNEKYLQSVKHILEVWKWEQAINVCSIAVGKIAAGRDNAEDLELLRFIYDNFHYQEVVNYGCFHALMESKKDEFVVDILNMIHDLVGTDDDKQIGRFFRDNFNNYFPNHYNRLDKSMFKDSKPYVQDLVWKMIDSSDTLFDHYQKTLSPKERNNIVGIALERILNEVGRGSPFDAIRVLKSATNEAISERLFTNLNITGKKRQRPKANILAVICSYFGTVNYPPALTAFEKIQPDDDYYAAVRVALFFQDKISSDVVVEDFLTETRPDRIKVYLRGFYVLQDRLPAVRRSTVSYMARDLKDDKLSTAITNYFQLIKQDRRIYDPQIGSMIKIWFGYKTLLEHDPLRIQDQMACLNIIETIINEANSKTYEDFLFFVAEQDYSISPTVSNLARRILKTLRVKKIGG